MKKILMALSMVSVSLMADFKAVGVNEFLKLQEKGGPIIDIRTQVNGKRLHH